MPKLPILSGREVINVLEKIGYRQVRQRGSHIRLSHPLKKPTTVPDHRIIGRGLLRKILRDIEMPLEDFLRYL